MQDSFNTFGKDLEEIKKSKFEIEVYIKKICIY